MLGSPRGREAPRGMGKRVRMRPSRPTTYALDSPHRPRSPAGCGLFGRVGVQQLGRPRRPVPVRPAACRAAAGDDPRRDQPDRRLRGHDRPAPDRDSARSSEASRSRSSCWPPSTSSSRPRASGSSQLRARYAHDLAVLGAELRAAYETPPPTVVGVVVDSAGFNQLLNGLNDLTAIERRNTRTAEAVRGRPRARSRRRRSPSHESRHGVGARPRRSSPSATRSRS